MNTRLVASAVVLLALAAPASAASVDIFANDTASPNVTSGGVDGNNDNRLRAYNRSADIDGWIKFDLSVIPDAATITSLTLTLFAEGAFGTPVNSPSIQVFRSSHDSWTRGGTGFPSILDEALTGVDTGPFPATRHTAYDFILDASAASWGSDLSDDTLSLVLRNGVENSYMYWFGSSPVSATGDANSIGSVTAYAPRLTIGYEISAVPLPASLPLGAAALGLLAAFGYRRRRAT